MDIRWGTGLVAPSPQPHELGLGLRCVRITRTPTARVTIMHTIMQKSLCEPVVYMYFHYQNYTAIKIKTFSLSAAAACVGVETRHNNWNTNRSGYNFAHNHVKTFMQTCGLYVLYQKIIKIIPPSK
jgi:glutaminase